MIRRQCAIEDINIYQALRKEGASLIRRLIFEECAVGDQTITVSSNGNSATRRTCLISSNRGVLYRQY
jgi:hypothetical protein